MWIEIKLAGKGGYLYCILGYWGVVSVDPDHVHADLNP